MDDQTELNEFDDGDVHDENVDDTTDQETSYSVRWMIFIKRLGMNWVIH